MTRSCGFAENEQIDDVKLTLCGNWVTYRRGANVVREATFFVFVCVQESCALDDIFVCVTLRRRAGVSSGEWSRSTDRLGLSTTESSENLG